MESKDPIQLPFPGKGGDPIGQDCVILTLLICKEGTNFRPFLPHKSVLMFK